MGVETAWLRRQLALYTALLIGGCLTFAISVMTIWDGYTIPLIWRACFVITVIIGVWMAKAALEALEPLRAEMKEYRRLHGSNRGPKRSRVKTPGSPYNEDDDDGEGGGGRNPMRGRKIH